MTRQRSLRVEQRNEALLPRIQALRVDYPFWGDCHIWAYLGFVQQLPVTKKRMLRLTREPHRLVLANLRLKAKRTPSRSKPKPIRPMSGGAST